MELSVVFTSVAWALKAAGVPTAITMMPLRLLSGLWSPAEAQRISLPYLLTAEPVKITPSRPCWRTGLGLSLIHI